jgi:hypothetical protein
MSVVNTHETVKSRKKPRPKAIGTPVMVRFQPELLEFIDKFRRQQPDLPNRPEAVRRLIESSAEKQR